ncbi:MAG: hypothetical protein GXO50_09615 [Chlorobi bacterium]|nr:hypothetical protein [Chlorobiota bacterium]
MKKIIILFIVIIPSFSYAQLYYYPFTDADINKKHKFFFVDNHEILWELKIKKDVKPLIKDLPYNTVKYYQYVSPKEYLITDNYIFFPNDKSLLVIDRKGKLVMNMIAPRKQLFDSTEYSKFTISTPGGKCEGNAKKGYFMAFCGDYLFYVTGNKMICMNRNNFDIIEEYDFKDFKNRAKAPFHKYIFEAVEFRMEIEGKDNVN